MTKTMEYMIIVSSNPPRCGYICVDIIIELRKNSSQLLKNLFNQVSLSY